MQTISAMINTYNEEKNITDCLKSLQWVDELVVVDSGSTDKTVQIAHQYAHKVVSVPSGDFSEIRNGGLQYLTSDWVLIVDADERVTVDLQAEIQNIITGNPIEVGFSIPRKNLFMGYWIRNCGWYPDYVLRLFRNSPQHRFSGRVHESVILNGKTNKLSNPLIHYTYESLEQYLNKFNRYTTLAAEMMYEKGRKANLIHLCIRPQLEFIKMFIFKAGFKDGIYGLVVAYMSSMYVFVKFAKLWLRQQRGMMDGKS
jgi:glycosyltransferase involved in cell wall biosynthesis